MDPVIAPVMDPVIAPVVAPVGAAPVGAAEPRSWARILLSASTKLLKKLCTSLGSAVYHAGAAVPVARFCRYAEGSAVSAFITDCGMAVWRTLMTDA